MKNIFPAPERLKSSVVISRLFSGGKSLTVYPLKLFWDRSIADQQSEPLRIGFSVPKKNIPRAVDRNLIRRRLREAYRQNKQPLHESVTKANMQLSVMVLYLPKKIMAFGELEVAVRRLIDKFGHTLKMTSDD